MTGYWRIVFLLICFMVENEASCVSSASHKCLVEGLLSNYGPAFSRPVTQYNKTVAVDLYMLTNQIIELNENDQLLKISATMEANWRDEFLVWNTTQYPGINKLHIPANKIWTPDLYLLEEVQSDNYDETLALISPDGGVYWAVQIYFTTSCKINARFFPFDTQNCTLTFASWAYENGELDLQIGKLRNERELYTDNGVWNLIKVHVEPYLYTYNTSDDCTYEFTRLRFTLELTRRSLYYVLIIVVPCTLLSLINLMVFILPTESGEKVSLGITNFLALVLVQQLIGELIPPADEFPIILNYYFSPMIVTGCLTVISGSITSHFHHRQSPVKVPMWLFKCSPMKMSEKSGQNIPLPQPIKIADIRENFAIDDNDEKQEDDDTSDITELVYLNGKEMAVMINKLMMFICLLMTVFSMFITALLFISL